MGYSEFIAKELQGVEEAIRLAKKARKTTLDLQDFFNPPKDSDHESALDDFTRDTFKYFDANSAVRQLESLQLQLGDLKEKLIEVKIENDRMLYAGGYLAFIDETIARIFLKNTLCKLLAQNENTPAIIEDSIQELEGLRTRLQEQTA